MISTASEGNGWSPTAVKRSAWCATNLAGRGPMMPHADRTPEIHHTGPPTRVLRTDAVTMVATARTSTGPTVDHALIRRIAPARTQEIHQDARCPADPTPNARDVQVQNVQDVRVRMIPALHGTAARHRKNASGT